MLTMIIFFLVNVSANGYQVWTSTCRTPLQVLDHKDHWDRTAAQIKGLNINFTSTDYYPGEQPGPDNWPLILSTYATAANQTFQPFTRDLWENDWGSASAGLTLDDALPKYLARGDAWGYTITHIMLYDVRLDDGVIYWWNLDDIAEVRNWLNNNGYSHVNILWNARQDSARDRDMASHAGVAGVLMEANFGHWETNYGARWEFLQWFTSTYPNRDVIFQLHTFGERTKDEYVGIRRFVRSISADILGSTTFAQSNHCIILPMTYALFHDYWSFLPEHVPSGDQYGDSMTGLLLSLIEQEDQFTGTAPGGLISYEDCASLVRSYDLRLAVADGSLTNDATWGRAIPAIGDTNVWQSENYTMGSEGAAASTTTFHGETLVIQTNGTLAQTANSMTFLLNNLVLDGGLVAHGALGSMTIDLNGRTLYLNSGVIQAGGANSNQNIVFKNAAVSGVGSIDITANGSGGSQVDFQSKVDLTGFSGTFSVHDDGILNLPAIENASFAIDLSGTGKYRLDDEVAVNALFVDGVEVPAGSYMIGDFTVGQQEHLIDGGGTLLVRSDRVAIQSGKLDEDTTWDIVLPEYDIEDTQMWYSGSNRLSVSDKETFEGGELVLEAGGELASDKANAILWIRDLTLDGGLISNQKIAPFYVNLRGHTLTLNSGVLFADSGSYNTDLVFQNALLAGSGTVNVAGSHANDQPEVRFDASVEMAGFSGSFLVTDNGVLALPDIGTPSFSLSLTESGKYTFNSGIVINGLTIDGVSLSPGVYYYDDFTVSQQAHLVGTTGRIVVFAPFLAVQSGGLNDPVTWGGTTPPAAGDTNIWRSLDYILNAGGGAWSTFTFHGDTLLLEPGSQLIPGAGGQTLQLNNLILDGGMIYNTRLTPFTLDLTGDVLTLNSGTIRAGISDDRDVIIRNGSLAGSGTIHIDAGSNAGAQVIFQGSVDTTGFDGLFNVHDNGILNLGNISMCTFGLRLSDSGRYVNDSYLAVTSLEIDGTVFGEGTYTYADFTPAQQAFLIGTTGTISVNDDIYTKGYVQCCNENETVTFDTVVDIAYGANGQYHYMYGVTGPITFNNATFGDPIPGVAKSGYYKEVASSAAVIFSEDFESTGIADGTFSDGLGPQFTLAPSVGHANLLNPSGAGNTWLSPVPAALGEIFGVLHSGAVTSVNLSGPKSTFMDNSIYTLTFTHFRRDDLPGDAVTVQIQTGSGSVLASETFAAVSAKDTLVTRTVTWTTSGGAEIGERIRLVLFDPNGGTAASGQAAIDNIFLSIIDDGIVTPSCFDPPIGDIVGGDCLVDEQDFIAFTLTWLQSGLVSGECVIRPLGDIAGDDCVVNMIDFAAFTSSWMDCGLFPNYDCP